MHFLAQCRFPINTLRHWRKYEEAFSNAHLHDNRLHIECVCTALASVQIDQLRNTVLVGVEKLGLNIGGGNVQVPTRRVMILKLIFVVVSAVVVMYGLTWLIFHFGGLSSL